MPAHEPSIGRVLAIILLLWGYAHANLEKTIFLGPSPAISTANQHVLGIAQLTTLSPAHAALRTYVPAAFPTTPTPRGIETWFLLDGLTEHQRYEFRVSWAATV